MVFELSSENVAQESYDPTHLPVATPFLFLQLLKEGFCFFFDALVLVCCGFFFFPLQGAALCLPQEQLVLLLNLIHLVVFHTSAP